MAFVISLPTRVTMASRMGRWWPADQAVTDVARVGGHSRYIRAAPYSGQRSGHPDRYGVMEPTLVTRTRTISWRGRTYSFQRLQDAGVAGIAEEWAVLRGGEFIGMLQCATALSTRDFDLRCLQWLTELLGPRGEPHPRAAFPPPL